MDRAAVTTCVDLFWSLPTRRWPTSPAPSASPSLMQRLDDSRSPGRWMTHREDDPWYPTMRIYRQNVHMAWGPVFKRMASEPRLWRTEDDIRIRGRSGQRVPWFK